MKRGSELDEDESAGQQISVTYSEFWLQIRNKESVTCK